MLPVVRKWRGLASVSLLAAVTLSACSDAGLVEPQDHRTERGDGASATPIVLGENTQDLDCGTAENPCDVGGIGNDPDPGDRCTSIGWSDREVNGTMCGGGDPPPSGDPSWPGDGDPGDGAGGGSDDSGPTETWDAYSEGPWSFGICMTVGFASIAYYHIVTEGAALWDAYKAQNFAVNVYNAYLDASGRYGSGVTEEDVAEKRRLAEQATDALWAQLAQYGASFGVSALAAANVGEACGALTAPLPF